MTENIRSGIGKETKTLDKDLKTLHKFIGIYCREKHGTSKDFCNECQKLFNYAVKRRNLCPIESKPSCKDCPVHCYKEEYREKIRQVMKYSGKRFYKPLEHPNNFGT